jgi:hypothetical protein
MLMTWAFPKIVPLFDSDGSWGQSHADGRPDQRYVRLDRTVLNFKR